MIYKNLDSNLHTWAAEARGQAFNQLPLPDSPWVTFIYLFFIYQSGGGERA